MAIELRTETNEEGCILVVSHKPNRDGHILKRIDCKRVMLHRYLYEQKYGALDKKTILRHRCDNPNCINLEHLETGTHSDNVKDRVERGRSAKGVSHGRAKLDEDKVRFIRSNTDLTNTDLAKKFKVDLAVIRHVKNYETWKHVD